VQIIEKSNDMRKKIFQIAAVLLGLCFLVTAQTRRIVDGIGGGGKYVKISDAITAAAAGDTIDVLQGTYTEAQTISIPKKLVIKGAGYKSNGTVIKKVGLSFADAADNSRFYGFRFDSLMVTIENNADNILIAENYFFASNIYMYGNTGDTVRNNIFIFPNTINPIFTPYNISLANVVICNNIFDGTGPSNNVAAVYLRVQSAFQSGIKIYNNYFGETTTAFYGDWNVFDGMSIVGNVFYKVTNITGAANAAQLFTGNWLFGITGTPLQPSNAVDNGSGDPLFTRFDQAKGFVFVEDTAQDTDFRIKTSAGIFPNSPIDASYRSISPMPMNYVDVQQQPGTTNTNRADAGIFGGPFPFKSPFVASTVAGVSSISATAKGTGGVVISPKGVIQVNVTGSFGGSATPK